MPITLAQSAALIPDEEILAIFADAPCGSTTREHLLNIGRLIEARANGSAYMRTVLEDTQLLAKSDGLWLTLGNATADIAPRGPIYRREVARWFTRKQQALHGQEPTA